MKIRENCFLLGIQKRTNKNKENYLIVILADSDGNSYNIVTKDMRYENLDCFKPYTVDLILSNNKYGMKLDITNIE